MKLLAITVITMLAVIYFSWKWNKYIRQRTEWEEQAAERHKQLIETLVTLDSVLWYIIAKMPGKIDDEALAEKVDEVLTVMGQMETVRQASTEEHEEALRRIVDDAHAREKRKKMIVPKAE